MKMTEGVVGRRSSWALPGLGRRIIDWLHEPVVVADTDHAEVSPLKSQAQPVRRRDDFLEEATMRRAMHRL